MIARLLRSITADLEVRAAGPHLVAELADVLAARHTDGGGDELVDDLRSTKCVALTRRLLTRTPHSQAQCALEGHLVRVVVVPGGVVLDGAAVVVPADRGAVAVHRQLPPAKRMR